MFLSYQPIHYKRKVANKRKTMTENNLR